MTTLARRATLALSLPLLTLAPMSATAAQTATPKPAVAGAMPNDKTMTCEMISAERTALNDAITAKAASKQKSAKLKKGLFGFAKGMAAVMVPGAAMGLGGGSMMGSLAAQGVSQSATQALSGGMGGQTSAPTAAAQPTEEQQARLTRLASIATYRQCAA